MLERLDKAFREYLSENVKTYTREELMGQSGSLPMELDQNSIDVYFDQYVERYYQQIEGTELYCAYDLDPEQDFYNEKCEYCSLCGEPWLVDDLAGIEDENGDFDWQEACPTE